MPTPTRKGILLVILAMCLVVAVAVIPDIISEEMRAWCLKTFGEGYQGYLLGFFIIGSVILLFLTTDIGLHLRPGAGNKPADLPPGTPDPDLVAKVRKYLKERYDHRLRQKLAGRQPVNLRILPSITGTSQEGAENYITLQEEEVRAAIGDIFTRANNRLLLVGLPGAGKTTLVLQLALHLLERPGSSMPVVLNLATWRSEFKTFEEWLKKILPTELGASTGLAEQIRKHTPLILLLDGLDEVPEADRYSLLAGIGEYGADANRQFLISSRIVEYAATKDAPVNAQVEVAQLTVEQVEIGLAATAGLQPESKRLLNALKADPLLRSAVENPFYLNTAQLLFSTGKNWSELGFVATDVAGRQRELVERFVEGALERKVSHEYPPEKPGHWLSFLASRMTQRNMVVFELRDLQYDWWRWERWQLSLGGLIYGLANNLGTGLGFGLGLGLIFGLGFGLHIGSGVESIFGLGWGLIFGLGWGLIFGLGFGLSAGVGLVSGTVLGNGFSVLLGGRPIRILGSFLVFILIIRQISLLSLPQLKEVGNGLDNMFNFTAFTGLFIGFSTGFVFGLVDGLNKGVPEIITKDNIDRSWKNFKSSLFEGLIYGLFVVLIFKLLVLLARELDAEAAKKLTAYPTAELIAEISLGMAFGLSLGFYKFYKNTTDIIQITTPYQRFVASRKALHFSIFQHDFLLCQLYRVGLLPLHLVTFLNELSLRHILEFDGDPTTGKGGGAWRFRHRILQEWFAQRWVEPEENKSKTE